MNFLQNKLFTHIIKLLKKYLKQKIPLLLGTEDYIFIIQSDIRQQDNLVRKPALKKDYSKVNLKSYIV